MLHFALESTGTLSCRASAHLAVAEYSIIRILRQQMSTTDKTTIIREFWKNDYPVLFTTFASNFVT